MANYVTKDAVKEFVKDVVAELDVRNNKKFAPRTAVNVVKSDLDTLEDKVANINTEDFVTTEFLNRELDNALTEMAKENAVTFDAQDVLEVFE